VAESFVEDLFDDPEDDNELDWYVKEGLALDPNEQLVQGKYTKTGWRPAHYRRIHRKQVDD